MWKYPLPLCAPELMCFRSLHLKKGLFKNLLKKEIDSSYPHLINLIKLYLRKVHSIHYVECVHWPTPTGHHLSSDDADTSIASAMFVVHLHWISKINPHLFVLELSISHSHAAKLMPVSLLLPSPCAIILVFVSLPATSWQLGIPCHVGLHVFAEHSSMPWMTVIGGKCRRYAGPARLGGCFGLLGPLKAVLGWGTGCTPQGRPSK